MLTSMFAEVLPGLLASDLELIIVACLWVCFTALLASKRHTICDSDSDSRYNMLLQRRAWANSS